MKLRFRVPALSLILASVLSAQSPAPPPPGATVIDDVFAAGNSQLQDLKNNSMWLFNGRGATIRTDTAGATTFDVTAVSGSSEAGWAYFTDAGKPILPDVGDKLSVSIVFSLMGFLANAQDIRWGAFDSPGTRNTTNLTGGQNDATFIGDTGYGADSYPSGTGSPFILGRRTVLSKANVFADYRSGRGAVERSWFCPGLGAVYSECGR